jgi:hypothetical protein
MQAIMIAAHETEQRPVAQRENGKLFGIAGVSAGCFAQYSKVSGPRLLAAVRRVPNSERLWDLHLEYMQTRIGWRLKPVVFS